MSGTLGPFTTTGSSVLSVFLCVCVSISVGTWPALAIKCSYLVRDLLRACMLVLQPAVARCIAHIPISVPSWARSAPNDPVS